MSDVHCTLRHKHPQQRNVKLPAHAQTCMRLSYDNALFIAYSDTHAPTTPCPMSIAYSHTNTHHYHVNAMSNFYCLFMHKQAPLPCQRQVQYPLPTPHKNLPMSRQRHVQFLLPTHAQTRTLAMSTPCPMSIAYSRFYAPA